jgi:hypothetical protein
MATIKLCDGKYTIIRSDDYKIFKALRYGEEWRSLAGDNLIAALCDKIEDLEGKIKPNNDRSICRHFTHNNSCIFFAFRKCNQYPCKF